MMTHNEMIAVIQHHKNGGKVQCNSTSNRKSACGWVDESHISVEGFDFIKFDYRPKPEPMALWGIYDKHGFLCAVTVKEYATEKAAKMMGNITIKKFIEVTE